MRAHSGQFFLYEPLRVPSSVQVRSRRGLAVHWLHSARTLLVSWTSTALPSMMALARLNGDMTGIESAFVVGGSNVRRVPMLTWTDVPRSALPCAAIGRSVTGEAVALVLSGARAAYVQTLTHMCSGRLLGVAPLSLSLAVGGERQRRVAVCVSLFDSGTFSVGQLSPPKLEPEGSLEAIEQHDGLVRTVHDIGPLHHSVSAEIRDGVELFRLHRALVLEHFETFCRGEAQKTAQKARADARVRRDADRNENDDDSDSDSAASSAGSDGNGDGGDGDKDSSTPVDAHIPDAAHTPNDWFYNVFNTDDWADYEFRMRELYFCPSLRDEYDVEHDVMNGMIDSADMWVPDEQSSGHLARKTALLEKLSETLSRVYKPRYAEDDQFSDNSAAAAAVNNGAGRMTTAEEAELASANGSSAAAGQASAAAPQFPIDFFEKAECITSSVAFGGDMADAFTSSEIHSLPSTDTKRTVSGAKRKASAVSGTTARATRPALLTRRSARCDRCKRASTR